MTKLLAAIALTLLTSSAHAEELLRADRGPHCSHVEGTWKSLKCIDVASSATAALAKAEGLEKLARRKANTPDEAQRLRNLAAFHRAEAERYSAKYWRKYGKK